jgi:excisionase family DNA binding protein
LGEVTSQAGVEGFPVKLRPSREQKYKSGAAAPEHTPGGPVGSGLTGTVAQCSLLKGKFLLDGYTCGTEYLSTGEAARIPGISRVAVPLMVQQGRVPAVRVGRGWAISREALLGLASQYQKGASGRKLRNTESGGK